MNPFATPKKPKLDDTLRSTLESYVLESPAKTLARLVSVAYSGLGFPSMVAPACERADAAEHGFSIGLDVDHDDIHELFVSALHDDHKAGRTWGRLNTMPTGEEWDTNLNHILSVALEDVDGGYRDWIVYTSVRIAAQLAILSIDGDDL